MTLPDDLATRLDALEAALPQLIADHPNPADFWPAFAGESDVIEDMAGEHCVQVSRRIAAMLSVHGYYLADVELDEGQ